MSRPKGSKNKKIKKERGRPKGSKTKIKKPKKIKEIKKLKRGRPKKLKDSKSFTELPEIPIPKAYKFIGYCSKCYTMISSNDLISKLIYICVSCGKRAHIKILKNKKLDSNKFQSKKDYLKTISSDRREMPVSNENESLENIRVEVR